MRLRTSHEFLGVKAKFLELGAKSDWYFRLLSDWILAGEIEARGMKIPSVAINSTAAIPVQELYFLGGDGSVRGFEKYSIRPAYPPITDEDLENDLGLDSEGLRDFYTAVYEAFVGGDRMFRFSTELRFPIYGALKGVTFLDAGVTWLDEVGFDIDDMREGAGLGLRINTPVGSIRLEHAWKLVRRPGESVGRWHIALGSTF